jgi:hypothetical protein
MADAKARKAAISKASSQVRAGSGFVRRATSGAGSFRASKATQTAPKKSR